MSNYCRKTQIGLMYIFFCGFLIVSNLIASTMSEISGSSFLYKIASTIQILIACAVYGFVFTQGYICANRKKPYTFCSFVSKLKNLFLPFVASVVIYWVVMVILGDAELKPVALVKIAFGYHFYILFVIFQFGFLSLFADKIAKVSKSSFLIAIALIITLASVILLPAKVNKYTFTTYLLCYVLGYVSGRNADKIELKAKTNFNGFVFLFIISLIITESISIIYAFSNSTYAATLRQAVSCLYNPVACVFILSLCTRLCKKNICNTAFFKAMYNSTYHIYLWHMLPIISVSIILIDNEEMHKTGGFVIKLLTALIVTAIVLLLNYRKKDVKNGTA